MPYFRQGLVGNLIGIGTALLEHIVNGWNVLGKFFAAFSDWLKLIVQDFKQVALDLNVAQTASLLLVL